MKALAIALAAMMGLFLVATVSVEALPSGQAGYCKNGRAVKNIKMCKENGGKM